MGHLDWGANNSREKFKRLEFTWGMKRLGGKQDWVSGESEWKLKRKSTLCGKDSWVVDTLETDFA